MLGKLYTGFLWIMIFAGVSCISPDPSEPQIDPPLQGSVVMVGNGFPERMQHYNYLETLINKNFPEKNLRSRNLGWSGDEIDYQTRPVNFQSQKNYYTNTGPIPSTHALI